VPRTPPDDDVESPELRAEVEQLAAERLVFFSDAVVAIAITLLALELPVPAGGTNAELLHSARANLPAYLAFLISFVVIAAHWRGHHRVFRYVRAAGPLLRWNLLWLLCIVITPFATRVLNGSDAFQVRFILYAGVQALAGFSLLMVVWTIGRHDLLRPGSPRSLVRTGMVRLAGLSLTFVLSVPLCFVTTGAYFFWFAAPLVVAGLGRLADRFAPRAGLT
jgi:uncharacterized membrane protein